MSFSMHARPAPTDLPDPETFITLKYAIARRWFDHDGSLRSDYITIRKEQIPFLDGIAAAGAPDVKKEAEVLIQMIRDNPQGVHVWIGDHDDYDH